MIEPRTLRTSALAKMLLGVAVTLCSLGLASTGQATEVPVVGISTGDATRGPLVDYLQAMAGLRLRTPGYDLIPPDRTAQLVDEIAMAPRFESASADIESLLRSSEVAIDTEEWNDARADAQNVLSKLEKDGGARVILGNTDEWIHARFLLSSAYVLDRPQQRRKKKALPPSDENLEAGRAALRPVLEVMPGYRPDSTAYANEVVSLFEEARGELRRTGTLSVEATVNGADVHINGLVVGQTPLQDYRLSAGNYEVQVGRLDKPSRIHKVEVPAGGNATIQVSPSFEFGLTTEGYAIVEAPPGQAAAPSAVTVGKGIATLTSQRYALVFAVEGADPLILYAAMVDADNSVVLTERTIEVAPGPVENDSLQEVLIVAIEGREVDHSWPAVRWAWLSGIVVTAGLGATAIVFWLDAEDLLEQAENREQTTSQVIDLEEEAGGSQTVAALTAGFSALALGLTIWFLVLDLTSTSDDAEAALDDSLDWRVMAFPLTGDHSGGIVGLGVSF